MKRRFRLGLLARYLAAGAFVMQIGPLCTVATSTATAGAAQGGVFIDANGNFLGLFPVCGVPDLIIGRPDPQNPDDIEFDDVANVEDDLMFGCPITVFIIPPSTEEGGGGGGG